MTHITLDVVGVTTDGKHVIHGLAVFRLHDQAGLPLEMVMDALHDNSLVVDWVGWWVAAMLAGWKPERAWNMATAAWGDVYGPDVRETLEARLREALMVREAYRQHGIEPYTAASPVGMPPSQ